MPNVNDTIQAALEPVYLQGDITSNIHAWMLDVGINPWGNGNIATYILAAEPSYSTMSFNDMVIAYFTDSFHTGFALLLETGDQVLQESGDFILLD